MNKNQQTIQESHTKQQSLNQKNNQNSNPLRYKIKVHPPKIQPKITNIGYGNPRYNSMVAYKNNTVIIPCGSSLRVINLKTDEILFVKQIGHSQIFQIAQNNKYILVVNFEGLLTFLDKVNGNTLQVKYQFHTQGKEIRHISLTDQRLVVSCQLSQIEHVTKLCVYHIKHIQMGLTQPFHMFKGHYYFPEEVNNDLIVIQYDDPNPKGKSRVQTVMKEKLPIKHRLVRFIQKQDKLIEDPIIQIKEKGEIVCAASNKNCVYYLHTGRKITVFDNQKNIFVQQAIPGKSIPLMIEKYRKGFIYSSQMNELTYGFLDQQSKEIVFEQINIKSFGVGGNLSIKPLLDDSGFFLFNENGIHHYCSIQGKTFTKSEFQITNCGLCMNKDGSLLAVADFAGNVSILETHSKSIIPKPLMKTFIGIPVRSLVWCTQRNIIVIGCVGGGLYVWDMIDPQPQLIQQYDHTINILRYAHDKIFLGNSDGQVKILDQKSLQIVYEYKAHHPIHYQTQRQRELFGSMKNYAQIWSLTISPQKSKDLVVISSSEDQTEKVFKVKNKNNQKKEENKQVMQKDQEQKQIKVQQDTELQHQLLNHLKGHELAVTSIDWKKMREDIGQVYVSCSDDKIVRFRDPKNNFKILFELQTSTIKQWHTLTYLSLEENGTRVAIGSQNGYLFIFDLAQKDLIFAQKIHLGGVQGLDWKNGKLCTCSSDLCVSIIEFE